MKNLSRMEFLKYCRNSAMVLGLSGTGLVRLEEALAAPDGPTVLWLQGTGCTGCSVSFLNLISDSDPKTIADVLVYGVNLAYHPNLMALAGESAVEIVEQVKNTGNFILAVEGGVPTAFGGNTCWAWTRNGEDVTFREVVEDLASKAAHVVCVGTCSSWGGIPAASPNPTGIVGVEELTGRRTINIAGCPPHPDWIVWTLVHLILGVPFRQDGAGRPRGLFRDKVHDECPRHGNREANTYGVDWQCVKELGCKGTETEASCPQTRWNNRVNWCVDANALCIGCTEPKFPFERLAKKMVAESHDHEARKARKAEKDREDHEDDD
jgi:hydrogenase small subunit